MQVGEIQDGIKVFGQRLNCLIGYPETGEINPAFGKLEFLRVEYNACLTYAGYEVHGSPPVLCQLGVIVDGVIYTAFLALH